MPLLSKARRIMRMNLERIREGKNPKLIIVGNLTEIQLMELNMIRQDEELPPMTDEVVFIGRHLYNSRVIEDGYTIEDVLDQIVSAMENASVVIRSLKMTGMENPRPRNDRYGNQVNDRVVFECTRRHPRPEIYSVIPKGDKNKPRK
jgi:hypothetical protein